MMHNSGKNIECLHALAKSVNPDTKYPSGSVGISRVVGVVLSSDKAEEIAPLLPWVLTKLENKFVELSVTLTRAINIPALHETLHPLLPKILEQLLQITKCAGFFLGPAHAIARSQNESLFTTIRPFLPEALKRASWDSSSWGNLACAHLDMNGNPDDLIESLNILLSSQIEDQETPKEKKLSQHLCSQGFIRLLNHKRVAESPNLQNLLKHYAGHIIVDNDPPYPELHNSICILTSIHPNGATGITYMNSLDQGAYVNIDSLDKLRYNFALCLSFNDIPTIAQRLFERMKEARDNNVREKAHLAFDALKNFLKAPCVANRCDGGNPNILAAEPT